MFAPVTCFVTFVLFGRRLSGNNLYRRVLTKPKMYSRPSGSVPSAPPTSPRTETSSGVSLPGTSSSSLPLGGQGKQEGSQGAPGVLSGGLPPLPLDLGRARGVEVPLGCRLGALPLLLRERAKWELPARCRLLFQAPPTSLSLPNSHRTFHDVRIRGRLRSLATACYPPVVLDLRIEEQGRIRGPGHVGVALVDVAVVLALAPLPVRGQEVESVDFGHRPLGSLLVPARAGCGRGLLTATACGVGAPGLDPWVDTDHTLTACGVTGGGLLTAPGRAISVCVSLPAGDSGRTLSRIARVTARGQAGDYLALLPACGGHAGDYLALLPACGQRRNPGGCWGGCLAASCGFWSGGGCHSCCRRSGFNRASVCFTGSCQVFFEPVRILFPVAIGGIAGVTASAAGSGGCCVPINCCWWSSHILVYGCWVWGPLCP